MNKVLLVEDDKHFRTLVKRLLERKFFSVVTEAEDGVQGLEALKKELPNLVFLDIDMPNMNGIQFLEEARKINRLLPIVMMSNHDESEYVKEAISLGIEEYLVKTPYVTQLGSRIETILKKFDPDLRERLRFSTVFKT
ncbi:MAG: response regulator [Bacteroidota bacterium]